jgi:hypothetical protein
MSGHDDELLARSKEPGPGEYFDFDAERVLPLPPDSFFREKGIRDGRDQRLKRMNHPAYLRGYELGSSLLAGQSNCQKV